MNAMLARQVAEIAVNEYREGIYKQEMQTAKGEIALAESALKLAENRLERTRRAHKRMKDMLAKRGAGTPADTRHGARHGRPPRSHRTGNCSANDFHSSRRRRG